MPVDWHDYPPDWPEISLRIRERAGGKCEWCPAIAGCQHPVTGAYVVLTVAHIDHDRSNSDDANLAALCQRCHLGHDAGLHARHRKYGRGCDGDHQLRLQLEEA